MTDVMSDGKAYTLDTEFQELKDTYDGWVRRFDNMISKAVEARVLRFLIDNQMEKLGGFVGANSTITKPVRAAIYKQLSELRNMRVNIVAFEGV